MSVLIKGMDMPSKCYECFLQNECDLVNPYFIESTRPQDCPLVEVPSAERKGNWVERHPMRYDGKFVGADTDIIPDTRIRHLYCGECDKQMPIFEKFPYCPYCGAKMVNRDAE